MPHGPREWVLGGRELLSCFRCLDVEPEWLNYGLDVEKYWSYCGVGERGFRMELRLQVPDDVVKKFQEKLGSDAKVTDIARDALTLYNWAIEERAKGRLILSSDDEGEKMTRLAMPSLEKVAPETSAKFSVA